MPIYEIKSNCIEPIQRTTFQDSGLRERQDLQRLLRHQIEVLAPDTLIVAEEFSDWEDSKRRVDLLGIDKNANLVVIELKRTEDGGHMDLQAIRYAAMVSTLTFEKVTEIFERYLRGINCDDDPRDRLLNFLDWDEPFEDEFAQEVRIILASAEFSKEITTAVLWLNERELDIRCIRMQPYADSNRVLLDVQQVIPLPEAEQYQVRVKEKSQRKREARRTSLDLTKYNVAINGKVHEELPKRRAVFLVIQHLCSSGITPEQIINEAPWRNTNLFQSIEGDVDTSEEFIERCGESLADHGRKFDARRFYTDIEDLIVRGGKTYCVSNQWGIKTREWVEKILIAFPDHGIEFRTSGDSK